MRRITITKSLIYKQFQYKIEHFRRSAVIIGLNTRFPTQSSRGSLSPPLTPPYMPFGIRRFDLTSRCDAQYSSQDS